MLAYYAKTALKTLAKYRFHSAVSLVSLTLGFFCFIAIDVLTGYLLSWDRHFPDSQQIFTVNSSGPDARTDGVPLVPRHLSRYLQAELPEIRYSATIGGGEYNVFTGDATKLLRLRFVEGDYLRIFPLPLLGPGQPISELPPDTALIMESAALENFGTTNVIGRRLVIAQRREVTIGGVVATMRRPSHVQSILGGNDLIVPMRVHDELEGGLAGGEPAEDWRDQSYRIYVKLASGHPLDVAHYNERLRQFSDRIVPVRYYLSGPHQPIYSFRPIAENAPSHFKLALGDVGVTRLLLAAGFLVLFVASLNYSNLVIAQLAQRSQEIAVQKVVGAKRRQLVLQFSLESLIVAGLSFLIALVVAGALLANVDVLAAQGFHPGLLLRPGLWIVCACGLLLIMAIAGAYPALRVSRTPLSRMLRPAGSTAYSHRLRSLMVGTQFACSSALLILAIFVVKQHDTIASHVQNGTFDPVIVLRGLSPETHSELDLLEAELRRDDSVAATTRTKLIPWTLADDTAPLGLSADPAGVWVALSQVTVGHDYFEAMQVPLLAGRTFSKKHSGDVYPLPEDLRQARGPYSIVIDRSTAARLGWRRPSQAVGKIVYTAYVPPVVDEPMYLPLTIVGVVADRPLSIATVNSVPTNFFALSPEQATNLVIRPHVGAIPQALSHVDRVWRQFYSEAPARPEFLDDVFSRSYAIFRRLGNFLATLALFSFGISCVGLIGMATFITRLRHREVGIRKILGANKRQVMRMLLMDYARPVLYANLAAWPIGFVLASAYLDIFYVQTPVTLTPFLLSLLLTLAVTFFAVIYQARRSARVRPASVLKYE